MDKKKTKFTPLVEIEGQTSTNEFINQAAHKSKKQALTTPDGNYKKTLCKVSLEDLKWVKGFALDNGRTEISVYSEAVADFVKLHKKQK